MADVKFPTVHIAQSVLNRLMNFADELESNAVSPPSVNVGTPPDVTDPTIEGAAIDDKLSTEVPPVADVADPSETLPTMLQGGNLIDNVGV